jgi:hypothetical protein
MLAACQLNPPVEATGDSAMGLADDIGDAVDADGR